MCTYENCVRHKEEVLWIQRRIRLLYPKIGNLAEWNNRNGMKFNSMKCKVTLIWTNARNLCCKRGIHRLQQESGTCATPRLDPSHKEARSSPKRSNLVWGVDGKVLCWGAHSLLCEVCCFTMSVFTLAEARIGSSNEGKWGSWMFQDVKHL